MIKYLDELKKEDLKGKKVLLRLDLNVPTIEGKVTDINRIEGIISTVDFLRQHDAQTIILAHIEDKDGNLISLLPVLDYLNGYFPVQFSKTYFDAEANAKLLEMKNKNVLLFENIRFNPAEKENDPEFAKKLSQMGDLYVNDAFSVSHRKHASIIALPGLMPHYGGLLLKKEIENLSHVFNPNHPFVFIIGGAKFDTKLPIIKKYLERADSVFVSGALAHNIFKELGYEIGTSLYSKGDFGIKEMLKSNKLITSVDVTVINGDKIEFKNPNEVTKDDCIVDAGPKTIDQLRNLIKGAKTIVWNGPLGNYEAGYKDKTESLAELIAEETLNGAMSIVGGGDTLASINALNIKDKFSFISTGGGAMLDYLVYETLPGIEALEI